jgi:hypothetical protein
MKKRPANDGFEREERIFWHGCGGEKEAGRSFST